MFFAFFGTVIIAGIIGYASERTGFTHNGYIPSIIICIGGAFLFFMISRLFHIGFGSPGMNAIISAIGALIIVPTHYRK
ncbi:hypothetical protein [Shimia abyssi]|uniref:Uncharacterized protein n=1 Tax=Shimia abyssi TaxID=1662395 RepID=A0A2P8F7Z9_9RHOB|nr:hypothetical protein [Shimia abyssi]PSL17846.1 hypothetical protein CLV88_11458 [Shimia abyssi]